MMKILTRYKWWVTAGLALVGLALIVWAALIESAWIQGLLINVGTSFLLLAPLLFLNQALAEKVDVLDAELRGRTRGLAALKEALPSGATRTAVIDAFLSATREPDAAARVSEEEFAQLCRGDEFDRTVALATSLGNRSLFDEDLVVRSVLKADSANEQFYALLVADARWEDLDTVHRRKVFDGLTGDDRAARRIEGSRSRRAVAQRILERDRAAIDASI